MSLSTSRGHAAHDASSQIDSDSAQYLTFLLADEVFAVGILVIKEIIQFGQLTTVPLMPPYIRGVINLRGAVVPVIDLHARFGRGVAPVGKRTGIVILEIAHHDEMHVIGIMVDAVSAVIDIARNQIEPPPSFGSSVRTDFIEGIGKVNQQFVIILDVASTFAVGELAPMATGA